MSNQQSEKPELPQHKPGSPWENQSPPTTSQLHLFCTTWSLFRTIFDPASWWLSKSCDSYEAAFCCGHVGPKGPNNKHSLEEHLWHGSTTSTVASLRVARLGWLPSQAKLPLQDGWQRTRKLCHCSLKVKSTIRKAELPQHKPGPPWENWSLPTTSQLHMFCTTWSLLSTILDPASCWLSQSCDSYAAAFAVEIWAKMGQITSTAWGNTCGPRCKHNFNSGILVNGKTRMAPRPSKTTTAGWLATNSKTMPLFMKCQINNLKSKASPTQTWIALGKLLATYNFAASLSCTAQSLFI